MSNFANRLKELMEEKPIDAKSLAEQLALSHSTIVYRWLKGDVSLLLTTAVKIVDFFDCSLDYLFERAEEYNVSYQECPPFDKQFRKVIKELNVSQNQLTKDGIISRGSLNSWLNKKQVPHIDSIIKLADYLKISMDYLVGREK